MQGFVLLEHTADVGVEAKGSTFEIALEIMAIGMFSIMVSNRHECGSAMNAGPNRSSNGYVEAECSSTDHVEAECSSADHAEDECCTDFAYKPETTIIDIKAQDVEEMVFVFLSDLLFIFETQRLVFKSSKLSLSKEQSCLSGSIDWGRFDEKLHCYENEIKAVTFHALKAEKVGDEWVLRVYFDL